MLFAFALSVERLVVSMERGVCSQWREACALSGERLVLSVERGWCLCAFWFGLVAIGLMRASDRDSLDASVAEMFSTV